jgi:F-type H+-transporting ATPase subunit b
VETLIAPSVNLFLLVVVLGYYLVGPLKAFAATRQGSIRDQLEESRKLLAEARSKFEDFTSRVKGLSAEAATLQSQAEQDAKRSRDALVRAAEQLGSTIVSDAKAAAGAMRNDLVSSLRAEVAERALSRAEEQIRSRLTGEERARLRQEFSALVEKTQ